jgi:carbamoyltransferase
LKILGISAFYHDSAAALVCDGEIISAAQEERFTRKKHDESFPKNAIKFCLDSNNLSLEDIDIIVFYDKPFLKLERILETFYNNAPKGWKQFVYSMPLWLKQKMFLKSTIKKALKEIGTFDKNKTKLLFSTHHLSHAASAYFCSPFQDSAILCIDGVGEWATASISKGIGNNIEMIEEMHFPNSVGLLYSSFTYFLGFKVNSGEYKMMGLAPYGNPEDEETMSFKSKIETTLVEIFEDGSIQLKEKYFSFTTSLKMINTKKWESLFNINLRNAETPLTQTHCNLALAIQQVTEDIVIKMAKQAKKITGSQYLCMAGGVALNCVVNGKLKEENIFKDIFIQPAAGDAGAALGAALAVNYMYLNNERKAEKHIFKSAFLGPEFSEEEIESSIINLKLDYTKLTKEILFEQTSAYLKKGKVVGWFQGKMEFGPRALGNRSIIADAANENMQTKLNLKIKKRESFRPFAPIMLQEEFNEFFGINEASPYMLFVHKIKKEKRKWLPDNFYDLPLLERLKIKRTNIQAITHLDFSARIQTIDETQSKETTKLLQQFKKDTGTGMLVNTSFNVRGEPIVCTPKDAIYCFMNTEMDVLVIGNYVLLKENQAKELFSSFKQTLKED